MTVIKILSGGQTGADIGGLKAAKILKLLCGGTVPKYYMTENGPNPKLITRYGCIESIVSGYQSRTIANVIDSDGTIIFANDWDSPGCICTLTAISMENKPVFKVDVYRDFCTKCNGLGDDNVKHQFNKCNKCNGTGKVQDTESIEEFQEWIIKNKIQILNVAGHRESKYPGIEQFVTKWLVKALKKSKRKS